VLILRVCACESLSGIDEKRGGMFSEEISTLDQSEPRQSSDLAFRVRGNIAETAVILCGII